MRHSTRSILLGSVVFLLLCLLAIESTSFLFYMSSLSSLDDALGMKGIPLAEASKLVRGIPFRTEVPPESGIGEKILKVQYQWPSLAAKYRINIFVNEQNVALRAGSDDLSYESPEISREKVERILSRTGIEPEKSDPKQKQRLGLAEPVDQRVMLAAQDFSHINTLNKLRLGSLARELVRQGVLIAARDEMGLRTCDELLGELKLVKQGQKSYPLEVDIAADEGGLFSGSVNIVVKLSRSNPSGEGFTWTSVKMPFPLAPGLDDVAEQMEILSRGNLIEGLKAVGFSPAPPVKRESEPADAPGEFINHMDFVAQYAVVRKLHSERRLRGETPENLKGLVRAYANLGNLIEYHWGPMSKVFKARAILYANRLLAKYGKTAESLALRSYAWTLAGNFKLAMEDAQAARKIENGPVPDWIKLIEAFCNYSPDEFDHPEGTDPDEMTTYLKMRLLAPNYDIDKCIASITDMLYVNPACSRAIEKMFQTRRLGTARTASEGGANVNWHAIHSRLCEVPGLPEAALEISREHRIKNSNEISSQDEEQSGRVKLLRILRQSGAEDASGNDFSWNVLAEALGDLTFVQSVRVLEVETDWLGLPREEVSHEVDKLISLLDGHRLWGYLVTFKQDRAELIKPMNDLIDNNNPVLFEMPCLPLATPVTWAKQENYVHLMNQLDNHWDQIYDDLIRNVLGREEFMINEAWDLLLEVAPNQPVVIARRLQKIEILDETTGLELEKQYQESPYLQMELGKIYRKQWNLQGAMRCFRKSVDLQPTLDGYYELAHEYNRRGKLQECQELLEEALSLESYGLEKAQTHDKLANLLMRQGKWVAAREHAEGAAESYSGWGLVVAARCAEGMKEWKEAESYRRACSERYENSSGDGWYMWCVRTGRGDLRLAKVAADRYWRNLPRPQFTHVRWHESAMRILDGNLQGAIDILTEPIDQRYQNTYQWVIAALLADKLGDPLQRDRIMIPMLGMCKHQDASAKLVNLFVLAMRNKDKLQWNEHAFAELVDAQSEDDVPYFYFCAGLFLGMRGEQELSRKHLLCAATNFNVDNPNCLYATLALREIKIPIGETRLNVHPDERTKGIRLMNLGYVARREKRFEDSRKLLNESMELIPLFTAALLERAKLSLDEGKPAEAIRDYEEILEYNPESQSAHLYLSQVLSLCDLTEVRNGEKALKHLNAAKRLRPEPHHWYTWLSGAICAERGEFERAIKLISDAIKDEPKDRDYPKMLENYRAGKPYYLPADKLP